MRCSIAASERGGATQIARSLPEVLGKQNFVSWYTTCMARKRLTPAADFLPSARSGAATSARTTPRPAPATVPVFDACDRKPRDRCTRTDKTKGTL